MARGRMISKSLSTSEKRAALHKVAGKLAEFAQQLYPLLVAHADDHGRLAGDLFTVKHAVDPSSPRKFREFQGALAALHQVRLIEWYEASEGRIYIQINNFEAHQVGLHKRVDSKLPAPSGKFPEFPEVPSELNRTELKGTEGKGTEENVQIKAAAAPRRTRPVADDRGTPGENFEAIGAIVQKIILPLHLPDSELVDATKDACAKHHIAYDSQTVRKAVDDVLARVRKVGFR